MINETQIPEQGRERIQKSYYRLHRRYLDLCWRIDEKYEYQLNEINKSCEGLEPWEAIEFQVEQGYYDILKIISAEQEILRQTPLGNIAENNPRNIFDRSDNENMRYASGLFRPNKDPVVKKVLTDKVCNWSPPKSRKRQDDRAKIYTRTMTKEVYEGYLSMAVGKPITIEEYEREFGFLSKTKKQ